MNQFRPKRGNGRSLQRSAMTVPAIGLMKHTQTLHHFSREKFPPARKQQRCVLCLIGDLSNRAASRSDVSVMSIQNEYFAKSEMQNISKNVRQVHRQDFGADRDRAQKMRRVRRTLCEIDGGKEQSVRANRYAFGNPGNDNGVRPQRIVRAVELQAAQRQDRQRMLGNGPGRFESGHFLESFGLSRALVSWRVPIRSLDDPGQPKASHQNISSGNACHVPSSAKALEGYTYRVPISNYRLVSFGWMFFSDRLNRSKVFRVSRSRSQIHGGDARNPRSQSW